MIDRREKTFLLDVADSITHHATYSKILPPLRGLSSRIYLHLYQLTTLQQIFGWSYTLLPEDRTILLWVPA